MSGDDETGRAPPNPTIQIDALTDVQLVDQATEEEDDDGERVPAVSAPPPLPKSGAAKAAPRTEGPSQATRLGALLIAIVAGAGLAYAVVHYVLPSSPTAPPVTNTVATVAAPPPSTAAPVPVRRITLDDEFVIRSGQPTSDPAPP